MVYPSSSIMCLLAVTVWMSAAMAKQGELSQLMPSHVHNSLTEPLLHVRSHHETSYCGRHWGLRAYEGGHGAMQATDGVQQRGGRVNEVS